MSLKNNWDAAGFWQSLSRAVEAKGCTWKMVSQETGVSSTTLSRMATGRRPDAASLAALSAWCGLNPASFVREKPIPSPSRFCPDSLASAIREMVKADIQGDGERYSIHETVMREQLHALSRALKNAGREVRFR